MTGRDRFAGRTCASLRKPTTGKMLRPEGLNRPATLRTRSSRQARQYRRLPTRWACPQRILLPNDRAIEPQARAIYESFGLNARQVELVARATPKRQYYLQSARGNRLFELGLGPIALALCATSDPATQSRIHALLEAGGTTDFAARFLASAGLDWAADLLGDASDLPPPLKGD